MAARVVGRGIVGECQQRPSAAFEEPGQLAVDQHDERAGLAAGRARAGPSRRGPGQCGAVGVRRVGGGQHDRPVFRPLRVDTVEVAAQPVDGRGDGELRAAQRLDEIATLAPAGLFECAQHLVEGGESAGNTFGDHRAPGQHAVPVQQQLGLVMGAQRGIRLGGRQRRPPAGHGRVGGAVLGVRDAVAAQPRRPAGPVRGRGALAGARAGRARRAPGRTCRR